MPDNHCQTTNISGTTTDEIVYSLDGSTYHPGFWVQDISTSGSTSELWVDWALVRKDATNPATYVVGDEEESDGGGVSDIIPVLIRYYRNLRSN